MIKLDLNEQLFEAKRKFKNTQQIQMPNVPFFNSSNKKSSETNPDKREKENDVPKDFMNIAAYLYRATILHQFDVNDPNIDVQKYGVDWLIDEPIELVKNEDSIVERTTGNIIPAGSVEGIEAKYLMRLYGEANWDRLDQNDSYFTHDLPEAGLAYRQIINGKKYIFPGENLRVFCETGEIPAYRNAKRSVREKGSSKAKRNPDGSLYLEPYVVEYDPRIVTFSKGDEADPNWKPVWNIPNQLRNPSAGRTGRPGTTGFDFLPSFVKLDKNKDIASQLKDASDTLKKYGTLNPKAQKTKANKNSQITNGEDTMSNDTQQSEIDTTEPTTDTNDIDISAFDGWNVVDSDYVPRKRQKKNEFTEGLSPSRINSIRNDYCRCRGIDSKKSLTKEDFNAYNFDYICCRHNAEVDIYKKAIFGDI